MDNGVQAAMLQCIYDVYGAWVEKFEFACEKGCAACCTRNVNMTFLEGGQIIDYLLQHDAGRIEEMREATHIGSLLTMTTNDFASFCLQEKDVAEEETVQDYSPCVFLENNCCTIYEVRPFGCRSFGSRQHCEKGGSADMDSLHLTVNMIVTQIVEHLDSKDGYWGNMIDVLQSLHGKTIKNVLPARPLPGMLVPPEDGDGAREFLVTLYKSELDIPGDASSPALRFGDLMLKKESG